MQVTEYFPTRADALAHALSMRPWCSRVVVSSVPGAFTVTATFTEIPQ